MLGFDPVSAKATLNAMTITMSESQDTALKEVVVIGYGTRKKIDNTTAITSLKRRRFLEQSIKCFSSHSRKSGWSTSSFFGLARSAPSVILEVWVQHWRTYATLHSRWMPTENINNINTNDITSLRNFKRCFGPCYLWDESGQRGNHNTTKRYWKGVTVEVESLRS
jgi:hypothetical protein